MAKKKVLLSIDEIKIKEFKIKAINADMTLSDYLSIAGSITPSKDIKKQFNINSEGAAIK